METRKKILDAALAIAEDGHYRYLSSSDIARRAGVTSALVRTYYPASSLPQAVLDLAIAQSRPVVVAQAILFGDISATSVSPKLRKQARDLI